MEITKDRARIVLPGFDTVFSVPDRVAYEEGLFADHGIDVHPTGGAWIPAKFHLEAGEDPLDRFEGRTQDTWNMCEWGAVNRVEQADRSARIAYLRPAVVAQAIITFRPEVQEPHDLANTPVGASDGFFGAHYTALQILEGALRRDQIILDHLPDQFERARRGELAATNVMEPFISLARKLGGHIVAQTFYRGAQVFGGSVTVDTQKRYVNAVNAAVDLINDRPDHYRSYVVGMAGGELRPEELSGEYYRYIHAQPMTEARFNETYAWMQSWGLATGDKSYEEVVNPHILR